MGIKSVREGLDIFADSNGQYSTKSTYVPINFNIDENYFNETGVKTLRRALG